MVEAVSMAKSYDRGDNIIALFSPRWCVCALSLLLFACSFHVTTFNSLLSPPRNST